MDVQAQFAEFNQSALRAVVGFAQLSVENTERIVNLNLESAKVALEESAQHARALVEVKDPQELAALRAKATEASLEKALTYSRNLYELANQTQAKVVQLLEAQFNVFNENMVSVVENAARSAPAGADLALAAVKSSVANGNVAVDTFKQAANQASRMTDNAVDSVQRAAENAVRGGKRKA